MRFLTFFFLFLCLTPGLSAQVLTEVDSDLRVLLVSYDPDVETKAFGSDSNLRTTKLYRERAAAWESLLRYHFKNIQVVYGSSYQARMSEDVDVTIFDARPEPITKAIRTTNPKTGSVDYQAATYLPQDFDKPALMISENSPLMGEPLGSKLDWL